MIVRPNGIGGSLGDQLATCYPLQTTGDVWYVNSAGGGADGASPAGKDRQKPLLTIGQAYTNAAAGDIIVCLSGHTETLAATLTVAKQLYIVGEGSSAGIPTVTFYCSQLAATEIFSLTTAETQLRNLKFPASLAGTTTGKVTATANDILISGCYFEEGVYDSGHGLRLNGIGASDRERVIGCTFISTATSSATRPGYGLRVSQAASDLEVMGCIFSDGTYGFANAAFDASAPVITRFRGEQISLLLGADMLFNASSTGYVNVQTSNAGGRVSW